MSGKVIENPSDEFLTFTPDSYQTITSIYKYKEEYYQKIPVPVIVYHITGHDFEVETPEGNVYGKKGDYLIVNSDGSMYPADEKVFKELYTKYTFIEESEPI